MGDEEWYSITIVRQATLTITLQETKSWTAFWLILCTSRFNADTGEVLVLRKLIRNEIKYTVCTNQGLAYTTDLRVSTSDKSYYLKRNNNKHSHFVKWIRGRKKKPSTYVYKTTLLCFVKLKLCVLPFIARINRKQKL